MFWNLIEDAYSPYILLIDENAVFTALRLCPYFLFFFALRIDLLAEK
jgi:hypothetical protein